jgi:hypothetical protein
MAPPEGFVSRRGLLVLIVVLAPSSRPVLAGRKQDKPAESTEVTSLLAFPGQRRPRDRRGVRRLALDASARQRVGWVVAEPFHAEADARRVEGLLNALSDAKAGKAVAEPGADLAAYGLEPSPAPLASRWRRRRRAARAARPQLSRGDRSGTR